jgi:hypothetical protein
MKWMLAIAAAAVMLVVIAPAQARAGGFEGTVLAKQPRGGSIVLVGPRGVGMTVRVASTHLRLGDRVTGIGAPLADGTIRALRLHIVSHVRTATVRGLVVRAMPRMIFVATGRSVLAIHRVGQRRTASAGDDGEMKLGTIGEFRLRIEDDELIENEGAPVAPAGGAQIEGVVVSTSPLVVSVEGLPITITVPAGITLPVGLAAGQKIELSVQAGPANTFTLVAVGEAENAQPGVANREVEAKGAVVSSTASQLVISAGGATLTFAAPPGVTLPTLAAGTVVEVRGISVNGVVTVERLRVEGGDESGDHGGGDGD